MFQIIKLFVESVVKLVNIDALVKHRDKAKLANIGVDLFELYATLNSIYLTGKKIVQSIENTLEQDERNKPKNRFKGNVSSSRLGHLLEEQANNLVRFRNSYEVLSRHLNIVDPDSTREVSLFIEGKANVLYVLTTEMKVQTTRGSNIFSQSFEDALLDVVRSGRRRASPHGVPRFWELRRQSEESISISNITDENLAFLKDYLRKRRPIEQLEVLRQILERLHESLVKNFEIKDILVKVGEASSQEWS